MSRMTIALLLLTGSGAAGAAPPRNAEQALANYRATFKSPAELDCPSDGDTIVVCGRREQQAQPERLPLPVQREAGSRIPGEPLEGGLACLQSCHQPLEVDLLKMSGMVKKGIERIFGKD